MSWLTFDPRVSVHLTTPECVHLHVRIPSPMLGRQRRLEEPIVRRFLACVDLGPPETADDPTRRQG